MKSFLIMLSFFVVVIGFAQDVPLKKRLYVDMIIDAHLMSPEQHQALDKMYKPATAIASRKYGESLADKGASCIMSRLVYEYKYDDVFKNIKFKPREKLLHFMNRHCSDDISKSLFKDLRDIIDVYHLVVLDGAMDIKK